MITITRRLASRLRAMCRRAFGSRGPYPNLCFSTSEGGLRVRAKSADVAVEFHTDAAGPDERLWLPFQALLDCEAKKDDPVRIEAAGKDRVTVQWQDRSVPQLVQHDAIEPADADKFPSLNTQFAENPASLLRAFQQAVETTDPGSVRFALGCVRMSGKDGSLSATDGRQLLVQSGFTLPWDEDLLVPKTNLFASPEFDGDTQVEVGKAENWVVFRVGEWTVCLEINKDGRFPDVSQHIPRVADATATCRIAPADASFLAETLPRLPTDDVANHPITVDLNGHVAVRAKPADQDRITEVILRNSTWSGKPVRLSTNRDYLARALKLGFNTVHLYGNNSPVFCRDELRSFVWMVLSPESAIPSTKDATRIESPADPAGAVPHQPRRRAQVPKPNSQPDNASHHEQRPVVAAKADTPAGAIEQAIALRDTLRDAANKATELIRTLQQDKKQARQLRSALASLREIQKIQL